MASVIKEEIVKTENANSVLESTTVVADSSAVQILKRVEENSTIDSGLASEQAFYKVNVKKGFRYGCYRVFKRAFDLFASLIMLLLLSPLILICLLIKWLEDFHNPIYVSKRVGKNGKLFRFYKIRTMRHNADKLKEQLIAQGLNEADGPAFKMKNDPRITRFGKILRKLSIDELLQLLNIINGSMSVVGPRPPLPKEVDEYTEEQKQRLLIKGGLLCLWQVQHERNKLSFDEWVKLDFEYIEKCSFWLDLKIIFKGAWMVVFDHTGE